MNTKALSMAVVLSLVTTGVFAADQAKDSKLASYQAKALATAQQTVAAKIADDAAIPTQVSLNLPRTIDLALQNNHSVKSAQWTYEAAKAGVSQAAAAKNPSVGYEYNAKRSSVNGQNALQNGTSKSFGNQFAVTVPIYSAARDAAVEAARYTREGKGAALEAQYQTSKLQAAKDYYGLIMNRNKVDIAQQSVRDYDAHLTNVNQQYAVGIVAKSDVLASKTSLAEAQTNLVSTKNAADIAESTLNKYIGLPVATKVETADRELGYAPYNVTLEQARAYAMLHRAELVEAAMAVRQAEENVNKAKAGHLPSVDGSLSKSWGGDSWSGTGDSNSWTIGAGVTWSIWDGGATNESIKEQKANLEAAKEANLEQIDAVALQVHQAYLDMKAAEQTINSTRVAVEQGQENFRIATLRYRAGVGINLDVLDAETKLSTARNNYVDALYNYNIAVATLEQAMGVPVDTPIGGGAAIVANSNAPQELANMVTNETK
ncbi:TolC family protein [uncultured Veillonella sp.]|uniref:TolC family protein n=1 Tax=uncultured Veillonella sp. TaxID=159268 RepID=UPI002592EB8A|nr:TolC family protein [uncultured Veillonella sp.]